MQQQQQESFAEKQKNSFNILFFLCLIHQRCLTIPMRRYWGTQALGTPCAWAFGLMIVWAALTQDLFLLGWLGLWVIYQLQRRFEAMKLAKSGEKIHSQYDGWPVDSIKLGRTEKIAKLVVEPLLVAAFGACLYWIYGELGMRPYGLPYFMLAGGFTLPFVEGVKQQIWERKIQGMVDAQIENEAMIGDLRQRGS